MAIHKLLQPADHLVIAAYFAILLGVGAWSSFRRKHSSDLFLGGRSLSWRSVGLSMFATNISAGALIGTPGQAYSTGLIPASFIWSAWLYMLVLAMVFAPYYLRTKVSSLPQFVRMRYGRTAYQMLSYYTLVATVVMWLGAVLYGGCILLSLFTGWPFFTTQIVLISVAVFFAAAGGLNAVVSTDSFQAILIMIGAAALVCILAVEVGSIDTLIASTPDHYWELFKPADHPEYPWPAMIFGYGIMAIWFYCADQTMVQRVLGAKDLQNGQKGVIFAAFLNVLVPLLFVFPGILGFVLLPELLPQDNVYLTLVAEYMPIGLRGLMGALLMSIVISTLTSGLNSFSTIFTLDVYVPRFSPDATARETLVVGRIVSIVAGLVAIALATMYNMIDRDFFGLSQSLIAFLAPPVVAVFIAGVAWPGSNSYGATATLFIGFAACLVVAVLYYMEFPSAGFWPPFLQIGVYLFLFCILIMTLVSILSRARLSEGKQLPTLFESYRQYFRSDSRSTIQAWRWWVILGLVMAAIYYVFS